MPPVGDAAAWAQAVEMKKSMSILCGGRRPARLGGAIMAQGSRQASSAACAADAPLRLRWASG
jgi:hypothetical protein